MFAIYDNNLVDMNRGDSRSFPIFLNKGTMLEPIRYVLQEEADKLVFYLCKPQESFQEAVLTKEMTSFDLDENGDAIIKFTPEDTLDLEPGVYFLEVKLYHTNYDKTEDVQTVITKKRFTILR